MNAFLDRPIGLSEYKGMANTFAILATGIFVLSILWTGLNPIDDAVGIFEVIETLLKWSYRLLLVPALVLRPYSLRLLLPMLVVGMLFGLVALTAADPTCLLVFAILVACRDVDPMRLIKVYLGLAIAFVGLVLLLNSIALIEPVYVQRGMDPFARTSLGLVHPNRLGTLFLSLGISWMVIRYKSFGFMDALIILLLIYVNARVCDSRTTTLVLLSALLGVVLIKFFQRRFGVNLIPALVALIFIVSGVFVILVITFDPDVSWMESIDSLLSSRLYNCNMFLHRYPPQLLGRDVADLPVAYVYEWTGEEIRFLVDNSIVRSLIVYGVPATFVMLAGVTASGLKEFREQVNEGFIFGLCMMALAGVMEATFFSIDTNPCLMIVSSSLLIDRRVYKPKHMKCVRCESGADDAECNR